jgi:pyridoxamine 5'-phosphate oxidase
MPDPISSLRREYTRGHLDQADLLEDPIEQFQKWFQDALNEKIREANAFALATASSDGAPSARMVLMKSFDQGGLVFATSYESRKAGDISANPKAAALFYWNALERQIRVEGAIEKTSAKESEEIFNSRPAGSRRAARASRQSQPIEDRASLESAAARELEMFPGEEIPRPETWGGYRIRPIRFEFWQGGPNRLHDRFEYRLGEGGWHIQRLQP